MRDYGPFWINYVLLDYHNSPQDTFTQIYHWFNLFEGGLWISIGAFILRRHFKHRHTRDELWYAFFFVTFGMTDLYEAWLYPTWLLYAKALNLLVLYMLRKRVVPHYYSGKPKLLSL